MQNGQDGAAFTLHGVGKVRGEIRVLDSVDLEIPDGRVTSLVGASGSGKTSLVRLLNRLDDPTEGEIRFRGRLLAEYPVRELRTRVGFVFQAPVLFPGMVRENLFEAGCLAGHPPEEAEIREAIAHAQLDPELLDRPGDRLSGGQQQRVTIARALMTRPQVLLLDEPTSALDPATADLLMDTVRELADRRHLTVVMVTHRLEEAARVSDFVVTMEAGRIVRTGTAAEILGNDSVRPASAEVRP